MRRIKLFEAFNNQKEIEKANHFLLCFGIYMFIKVNGLKIKDHGKSRYTNREFYYIGDDTQSYFKGEYYPDYASMPELAASADEESLLDVNFVGYTLVTLKDFLKERKIMDSILLVIPSYTDFHYPKLYKALRFVINAMIENEKNVSS